ncbi:synaptic vesicle glycoprotein 2B-like [Notothenia coriiceps]|uniref:Synaptic vesicle glycoprotein 2B-like n=1 Tax=Notothenia coriiceps TaxID=8208 RepID=A0A6I9MH65_9TELE|nr:PREDICTED: synaptic vesicle glycoprotein 2B-like [Notothenia coriiceps]
MLTLIKGSGSTRRSLLDKYVLFNSPSFIYFQVTHIKAPKTAEDEFIEIQSATGTALQRWAVRSLTLCKLVLKNVASLLSAELRFATLFMAIIWFCMAFSYYGLSVWFPDMIKHLQYEEYESKVKVRSTTVHGTHDNTDDFVLLL